MPAFFNAISTQFLSVPSIITDNLSLHLNANNPASYPGSGTTWFDLTANANHGTLTNGAFYNSSDGGSIEFDGVNDFVTDNTASTGLPFAFGTGAFTIEQWVNIQSDTKYSVFFDARRRSSFYSSNFNYSDYYNYLNGTYNVYINSSTIFTSNGTLVKNQWYHFVFSRSSTAANQTCFYINGVLDKTITLSTSLNNYGYYYVGRSIDGNYAQARIAQVRVYKGKGLTAAEVTQNWNATKGIYGY